MQFGEGSVEKILLRRGIGSSHQNCCHLEWVCRSDLTFVTLSEAKGLGHGTGYLRSQSACPPPQIFLSIVSSRFSRSDA